MFILKAVHLAPAHLLSGWMTKCNHQPDLLVQTMSQTGDSVLLVAKQAYDSRDLLANQKLQSYLGALDVKSQAALKPLIYNPFTVNAALKLLTVPLWKSFLMNEEKLRWINSSGFTDLVSVSTLLH